MFTVDVKQRYNNLASAWASYFKILCQSCLCYGQDIVRRANLYGDRSCIFLVLMEKIATEVSFRRCGQCCSITLLHMNRLSGTKSAFVSSHMFSLFPEDISQN